MLWWSTGNAIPLQNRVLPTGEIVATPARGTLTGNRGIIHVQDKVLGKSRWSHHAWISCVLDWQGRKRSVMMGRKWTELFFLDEAVAMAAGHRPCGYCRRADYTRFADAWDGNAKAPEMDQRLHKARIVSKTRDQKRHQAKTANLPQGAMILLDGRPHLLTNDTIFPYTPEGYSPPAKRPTTREVTVLTPEPMLDVLHAGYHPLIHPTAAL